MVRLTLVLLGHQKDIYSVAFLPWHLVGEGISMDHSELRDRLSTVAGPFFYVEHQHMTPPFRL
jgi:hypothetical protein